MESLAGDLLLGLKFVKLEILSTSFIDFLYDKLGELRLRSLELKFVKLEILSTSFIDFLYGKLGELRSRSLDLVNPSQPRFKMPYLSFGSLPKPDVGDFLIFVRQVPQ